MDHVDVLVVGAGISGIGAACHLEEECPSKSYAVLEARDAMGGTWDLFRYPGIRSDSDMFTLGYRFKPWTDTKTLADGPAILSYVRETAREHGVEDKIRYGHKVVGLSWSSEDARWTVQDRARRRADRDDRRLRVPVQRLLRLRRRLHAGVPGRRPLRGRSWCIRRSGPRTWTTRASAWWSSAAARPP